ncbi:MAG: CoA pyrophosphatase [Pseudomonadota bacterium]
MQLEFGAPLRAQIAANLDRFTVRPLNGEGLRRAAVALVVVSAEEGAAPCVLLTLRPVNIKRHSNQYALPGGRLDDGETPEQAALRELHEELGVDLPHDEIIGPLDDYATRSGFLITPVVVWGGAMGEMAPDPGEVDSVYRIPFSDLLDPAIPILTPSDAGEHPILSAHIATLGHTVWAPTAALLYQFREVAIRGLDTRVAHFDQPAFARK